MTLIHHPGSDHQMAAISIDAGHARDIMLMLADAHAVVGDLAGPAAPAAARQAAAALRDADPAPTPWPAWPSALGEIVTWLHHARRGALAAHTPRSPDPGHERRARGFLFISPLIRNEKKMPPGRLTPEGTPRPASPPPSQRQRRDLQASRLRQPAARPGRGRTRQFCSADCARRYHNDARVPAPAGTPGVGDDPLAVLDALIRQAAVLIRACREQAASLDPASVRAQIADAEAARRRAEAATITAQAQAAEAREETTALAEALAAARDDTAAAQAARGTPPPPPPPRPPSSSSCAATPPRRSPPPRPAPASRSLPPAPTPAGAPANATTRSPPPATPGTPPTPRSAAPARPKPTPAPKQTGSAPTPPANAAPSASCQAQLAAASALTDAERARAERAEAQLEAERAERRTLTSHLTTSGNGQAQPAPSPDHPGGARSKQNKPSPPQPRHSGGAKSKQKVGPNQVDTATPWPRAFVTPSRPASHEVALPMCANCRANLGPVPQ